MGCFWASLYLGLSDKHRSRGKEVSHSLKLRTDLLTDTPVTREDCSGNNEMALCPAAVCLHGARPVCERAALWARASVLSAASMCPACVCVSSDLWYLSFQQPAPCARVLRLPRLGCACVRVRSARSERAGGLLGFILLIPRFPNYTGGFQAGHTDHVTTVPVATVFN